MKSRMRSKCNFCCAPLRAKQALKMKMKGNAMHSLYISRTITSRHLGIELLCPLRFTLCVPSMTVCIRIGIYTISVYVCIYV